MTQRSRRALAAVTCLAIACAGTPPVARAADTVTIRCESKDGQRQECAANTSQGVVLSRQLSAEGCWQGESWGIMPDAIWVTDNCRAEFTVGAPPQDREKGGSGGKTAAIVGGVAAAAIIGAIIAHNKNDDDWGRDDGWRHDDDYGWGGGNRTVRCESRRGRRNSCWIGRYDHVELRRQLSDDGCRRYRTWGTTRDSIWVDEGCRAEFWVRR